MVRGAMLMVVRGAMLMVATCASPRPLAPLPSNATPHATQPHVTQPHAYLRGIDVSHYQGSVNWKSVAASGISFASARSHMRQSRIHRLTMPCFYRLPASRSGKGD